MGIGNEKLRLITSLSVFPEAWATGVKAGVGTVGVGTVVTGLAATTGVGLVEVAEAFTGAIDVFFKPNSFSSVPELMAAAVSFLQLVPSLATPLETVFTGGGAVGESSSTISVQLVALANCKAFFLKCMPSSMIAFVSQP